MDNINQLAELKNLIAPSLNLITLIINSFVFDSNRDKDIILKIYHLTKNELKGIKNRNDIQKIKLLLYELEINAIGSKAEYCKWKNITDTEWSTIGHITSCTDFNRDNIIPIKYKHCPLCGKEIDIAY